MSAAVSKNMNTLDELCDHISQLIAKESGNLLGQNQKSMVVSRIKKRMIDLGNLSPSDYYKYLMSHFPSESTYLISILTTHHTFFFREFSHFEFLESQLPKIVQEVKNRGDNKIRVYSAACSRGQEVYSLAMFLHYHLQKYPGMDFEILGSDIDPSSIKFSQNGVYNFKEVIAIPKTFLANHWQRGTGDISAFAKIKNTLKNKCKFETINLLEIDNHIKNQKFDVVFCRNVFIYFDAETIQKVCLLLKKHIYENGYLITGLSESLKSLKLDLVTHAPSVYSFAAENQVASKAKVTPLVAVSKPTKAKIRMLVVDDSPVVVKLLTSMFKKDPDFELVGTAGNGREAEEFLLANKVDAMTLDIHMPIMDGVSYLQKNYKSGHPKVIVVTSASREDARYAQKTIEYGASDFVEKPSLANLNERFDEIKTKIKMSLSSDNAESSIDKQFVKQFDIAHPESKARMILVNYSEMNKVKKIINELVGPQPPLFIYLQGNNSYLEVLKDEVQANTKFTVTILENQSAFSVNTVYLCDFDQTFNKVKDSYNGKKVSLAVVGACTQVASDKILGWSGLHLLLDERNDINLELKEIASDIFPWTSFPHVATEFLSKD